MLQACIDQEFSGYQPGAGVVQPGRRRNEASAAATPAHLAVARPELGGLLSILFLHVDELESVVVTVTSARPGEGVTTLAREIAAGAAATGWCRVALVDAHPQDRFPFGAESAPGGLLECLERGEEPKLEPRRLGSAQVETGTLTRWGSPVSSIESVRNLYGALRKRYSMIVVDCPSVSAGAQPLVVSAAADRTILVLEAERTSSAELRHTRRILEERGASMLGVVMNKSRRRLPKLLGRFL